MRYSRLVIAGYKIGFRAKPDGPELILPDRFRNFADTDPSCDLIINIHEGHYSLPETATMVFQAPFAEETHGKLIVKSDSFWSIWKEESALYIKTSFPLSRETRSGLLKFSLTETEWDFWTDGQDGETDPMEYPLDGLILYYLTTIKHDIFIHASGVSYDGQGFIFSGISGKGKSTMAEIWRINGAEVIHDDRIIIRKPDDSFYMFNTPVYSLERAVSAKIKAVFIIDHGITNRIIPLNGSAAVSQLTANCIQHAWNEHIISGLVKSVSELCNAIPVFKLSFRPAKSVMDLILREYGKQG